MKTDNLTISVAGAFNPADQSAGIEYVEKTAATRLQATGEIINANTRMLMGCAFEAGAKHGRAVLAMQPSPAPLPVGVSVEKDFLGTVHIKIGDFDFIQIQYDHRFTYNSHQEWVANQIVAVLTAPPAAEQPDTVKMRELIDLVMRCDITGGGVLAAQRAAHALLGKDGWT